MFDTMTLTKAFGALCGALLIFLLGGWAADGLYRVGGDGDGSRSYVLIQDDSDAADEPAEEVVEVAFADVYAAADAASGERLWRQCAACHRLDPGAHAVGPSLHDIVGRPIAAADGFSYSNAFAELDGEWTPERMSAFIENPRQWAPGTAMAFNGISDVEDRANLIAYLETIGD
ncbi:membrane c-type cytochrome cy [Roseibacterium elongatum DSM 19469]|uniref:Membrane c-type cytochrome cy n=1 Tax=Roseicyclus elongatus DSM 19469 TaxID=1294273 RepID=W8S2W1_9RHOB|nr:c-type cytochrome [Roseibacterium elongatum]AHM03081.1 membrane c-type cytochrome cy [Roseibacterium elongatum DSM 19469]